MSGGNPLDALSGAHTRNTVVVLGASYAGNRAVNVLVQHLPPTWRVIVLERNTHANHLYAFPRMAILPNQAHKVFIPYTNIFGSSLPSHSPSTSYPHLLIHGSLTSIHASKSSSRGHLTFVPMDPNSNSSNASPSIRETQRIDFDFCVYALGSHLPPPINIWSGPGPLPLPTSPNQKENQNPSAPTSSSSGPDIHSQIASHDSSSVALAKSKVFMNSSPNHPDSPSSDQDTDLTTEDSSSQSEDLVSSSDFSRKINLNGRGSDRVTSSSSFSSGSSDKELNSPKDVPSRLNHTNISSTGSMASERDLLPLSPPSSKHPSNGSLRSFADSEARKVDHGKAEQVLRVQLPLCRGTKKEGMAWLEEARKRIEDASSVLVIGGGALGVQFASDIAEYYTGSSSKHVTLAHSGQRLLPRFDPWMHNETYSILTKLGVYVLLGSRIDLNSIAVHEETNPETKEVETIRTVKTLDGRRVKAELILFCTGQTPNTKFLKDLLPNTVDERSGMAKVNRSMQLAWSVEPDEEDEEVGQVQNQQQQQQQDGGNKSSAISLGGGGKKKKKKNPLWKVEGDHDWPHALASPNEYTPFPPPPETCVSPAKRDQALPNISASSTSNSTASASATNNNNPSNDSSSSSTTTTINAKMNSGEALPITPEPKVALPNVFVIGDAADAFGALKAGHTAWTQAEVAARNICRIIASRPSPSSTSNSIAKSLKPISFISSRNHNTTGNLSSSSSKSKAEPQTSNPNLPHTPFTPCSHDCACMETLDEEASKGVLPSKSSISKVALSEGGGAAGDVSSVVVEEEEDEFEQWKKKIEATIGKERLEKYHPPPPSIKVSLGLTCAISQSSGRYSIKGPEECPLDLNAPSMWTRRGLSQEDMMI